MDDRQATKPASYAGKFSLRPSTDRSALFLSAAPPADGGAHASPEDVVNAARSHGVTVELDLAAIQKTLLEGGVNVRVAVGRAPVPGADGRVEMLVGNPKKRSPHLDEHGLADFRDLGEIVTVKAGQPLMRLLDPVPGVAGVTVMGTEIAAPTGKKASLPAGLAGVAPDPADPHLLVAAITGCPVITKDGVSVEAVYRVENVDLHTGNVSYDGGVHVTGDVHSGMTVKASGDIFVGGTVEDATLDAGGDVTIAGGIAASDEDTDDGSVKMRATIKCAGSCTVKFAQDAHIIAGNGIFIHDSAINCDLVAAHQIIVGGDGRSMGELIGGIARATMFIKAHSIGSEDHPRTIVIAGNDKDLFEHLRVCNEKRKAADNKFADVLMALGAAKKTPGKTSPEEMEKLDAERVALLAEIAACTEQSLQLKKEIDLAQQAQVVALKRVFADVEIRIGQKHVENSQDRECGVFRLENGDLVFN